jgi:hypothetical protein
MAERVRLQVLLPGQDRRTGYEGITPVAFPNAVVTLRK